MVSLADVHHQPKAHQQVQRALARDRVPHAYIFHGPEGVGKETFARGMAQLLLCPTPVTTSLDAKDAADSGLSEILTGCGTCDDCRTVAAGTHPDLHIIYRQLNREHSDATVRKRKGLELGVDVIREFLIDKVARTPLRGRAKVFIIREADVLNVEAQNALLKTLEEPPGATYLILLVASLDCLLPTTQSRCQIVDFQSLPEDFVKARLHKLRPELKEAQRNWYAAYATGSIGDAVQAVDDGLFELSGRLAEVMGQAQRGGAGDLIRFFTDESKSLGDQFSRRDPEITDTESARRGLKVLFRLASDQYARQMRTAAQEECARTGNALEELAVCVERLSRAEQQLDLNANVQLVVESLANDLVEPTGIPAN